MKLRPANATPVSVTTPTQAPESATKAPLVAKPPEGFRGPSAAGPTDIDGAHHGYVAPHQVESPFSPQEKAALAKKIPCPALAGLFQAGMLKVAKDGTVKIPDLERALSGLGPSPTVRKVLTGGADKTDSIPGDRKSVV